ncbi:MAG: glucose-6-phosphate dehydrogenase [Actinobacteria bacterium]|nr:glucose-6-phosphate dehydrogenase [Actinomycetota bacterium]
MRARPAAHAFVVLGATGDLATRKLLPALYHLSADHGLETVVLGGGTRDLGDEEFRRRSREALTAAGYGGEAAAAWCSRHLHYFPLPADGNFGPLASRLAALEAQHSLPGNRVLYLALPPQAFPAAISGLGAAGLAHSRGWTRLVIEKPFGSDLATAGALNELVHHHFTEDQVFRIDHYLGKETVQNLLVFRFANPLFEASWNRDRVARVEITVAEDSGVGTRGRYYDGAGAIRDMLQSHLTQLLTLVAMEAPVSMAADAVRAEKVKVLRSIRPLDPAAVVLGQYAAGGGTAPTLPAYRDLDGVAPGSNTPTYAAATLFVDNWRWQGIPFHLRTGKGMRERLTQVAVTFRPPPVCLYHGRSDPCVAHSNVLYLDLQPDEGFRLEIEVKEPGPTSRLRTVPLRFAYAEAFGRVPEAYETLLLDVVEGDQTLFVHADEVEESWRLYQPLLDSDLPVHAYPAGSWGPAAARDLLLDAPNWAAGG